MKPIKETTDSLLKYILPDDSTAEEKEANPIQAQEVVDAIKAGKSVEIKNAVIEGSFNLESVVVEGKITIQQTRIKGPVDCSYAEFKQVVKFENSTFESDVIFTTATIEKDIFLNNATFEGKADFTDLTVKGAFYGNASTFEKNADFLDVRIGCRISFIGALFKQLANFNSAQIEGCAFFNPATFEGEADFVSSRIGSNAEFTGAIFKKRSSFNSAEIERVAFFDSVTFEGEADFVSARIGGNAEFTGAIFKKMTTFNRVRIEESAFFRPATFEGEANFVSARIGCNAEFQGAQFGKDVTFYSSQFKMGAFFLNTVFAKDVSFQNASFDIIFFTQPEIQFLGKIDLRGCVYGRIEPSSVWGELMDRLEPYDREPFTQLEGTFRRAGQDNLANKVYYKRKRVESSRISLRRTRAWILDRLHWWITGYGVQLWRLLIGIVFFLVLGTFIFGVEGAVEPNQSSQLLPVFGPQPKGGEAISLTLGDAISVSLNLFLPVEIPAGSEWKPSSQPFWWIIRFTWLATLLKLAGWIIVPLLVAGLSGWLKR